MFPAEKKNKNWKKKSNPTYNFCIYDQCHYKMQERILKTLYMSFQSWLETVRKALTSLLWNDLKLALFKRSKNHWKILRYHGYGGHSRYSKTVKWVYWLLHKCFSEFVIAHRRNYRVGMWKKRSKKTESKGKRELIVSLSQEINILKKHFVTELPFFSFKVLFIFIWNPSGQCETQSTEKDILEGHHLLHVPQF